MINVIIFSHCRLIQFALQKMAEDTLKKNNIPQDTVDMIRCSVFTELIIYLSLEKKVICLFDIDGVDLLKRRCALELINTHFGRAAAMVLYTPAITRLVFDHPAQKPKHIVTKFASLHELEHRLSLLLMTNHTAMADLDGDRAPAPYVLTDRQQEVLKFIMLGMNNRTISTHMGISDKTVSSHRKGIYKKYYVDNVIGLYHKIHHTG